MTLQPPFCKSECGLEWLPEHSLLEIRAVGDGFPDAFEGGFEAALAEAGEVVGCCPEQVGVGEVEEGLGILEIAPVWQVRVAVLGR